MGNMAGDIYMHLQIRPPSLQIMACGLFGVKPLSEPMQNYFMKMHVKMPSVKWRPICLDFNVLRKVCSRKDVCSFIL